MAADVSESSHVTDDSTLFILKAVVKKFPGSHVSPVSVCTALKSALEEAGEKEGRTERQVPSRQWEKPGMVVCAHTGEAKAGGYRSLDHPGLYSLKQTNK